MLCEGGGGNLDLDIFHLQVARIRDREIGRQPGEARFPAIGCRGATAAGFLALGVIMRLRDAEANLPEDDVFKQALGHALRQDAGAAGNGPGRQRP